ncbi:hypothetical protein BDP27DRAFT_1373265 [Rhodocollybia butyracea]|uniref:Uncharacterized protein n=1 Tax=Rhodocollybia butyracea TaxID=206335 RepID=A0A9P5P3F7_9AGAR|nr:hypothetical protein BDP27DRAFT_1373265 [Rhodocollybia butyracea]
MSIFLGKSIFPPARQHRRSSELLKDSEDYFLKCWPFKTKAARQHFSCSVLVDFAAKTIPDTEHWEKLVFAGRATTWAFLMDDMIEVDVLYENMSGLLQVIYGNKVDLLQHSQKPDPNLYWEVVSDDIWRGIQRGCTAVEFDQMTCTLKEWYITAYGPLCVYAMECRVTDEELTHPTVREAEDSAAGCQSVGHVTFSDQQLRLQRAYFLRSSLPSFIVQASSAGLLQPSANTGPNQIRRLTMDRLQ